MSQFHIFPTVEELSRAAAIFFVETAKKAVDQKGRFIVALTGGSSPQGLYELLSQAPFLDKVPWKKTFIFWGDERWVPMDDSRNNARMAYESLLNKVPVPKENIFPMSGTLPPAESAHTYEAILKKFFPTGEPRFDLILLGMGEDGHTASLFPHTPVLQERERWVKEVYHPGQQMYRITLTAPLINKAANIAFLVFGSNKAQTLYNVLKGPYQPEELPTQLIMPGSGEVHWFLDRAVASTLGEDL